MRRLIKVLVLMIVLFSITNVSAEIFTFRNGIKFGMSVDEVTSLELNKNNIIITPFIDKEDGEIEYYQTDPITVAGYDGTTVHYGFDDAGKLYWIEYWIEPAKGYSYWSHLTTAYELVAPSLEKYDEISIPVLDGLDRSPWELLYPSKSGEYSQRSGKSERLAVFDSEYVLIEHLSMVFSKMPFHIVSYRLQDTKVVAKIYQDFLDTQKSIEESLESDF